MGFCMYSEIQLEKFRDIIKKSRRAVFFGGAGVSTESGIPDFRSQDGVYKQKYAYPPEFILSATFFKTHTKEFFEFYRDKMIYPSAKPNMAHIRLAEWESMGLIAAVITQNIDGLHQQAGSKNVLELHGSVWRNHCVKCGKFYSADVVMNCDGVPRCTCGGVIKPDVVLYEEQLDSYTLEKSVEYIRCADTLIIGGTSLNVYPAAGLIDYFGGDNLVVVNKGATAREVDGAMAVDAPIAEFFGAVRL